LTPSLPIIRLKPLRGKRINVVRQEPWTIKDLLEVTSGYLKEKGIDSPRLSAEVLLAHQLKVDRVKLYLNFDQPLHQREIAAFRELIKRRLKGEPIQYITGIQEFWSLNFVVNPHVLIPRPETELLVEQVVSLYHEKRLPGDRSPRVLDLGTGSGVLAVAIAQELEGASVWASDLSADTLAIAELNAKRHGVEERVKFILSDVWQGFANLSLGFDAIVSNPPYIPSDHIGSLAPEIRDYEPRSALDGGEKGMHFIKGIIAGAPDYLSVGGWILVEMDPKQTLPAMELMERINGYGEKYRVKDYTGQYRVVVAQRD
jgi:release factor glutamine methyltransferase